LPEVARGLAGSRKSRHSRLLIRSCALRAPLAGSAVLRSAPGSPEVAEVSAGRRGGSAESRLVGLKLLVISPETGGSGEPGARPSEPGAWPSEPGARPGEPDARPSERGLERGSPALGRGSPTLGRRSPALGRGSPTLGRRSAGSNGGARRSAVGARGSNGGARGSNGERGARPGERGARPGERGARPGERGFERGSAGIGRIKADRTENADYQPETGGIDSHKSRRESPVPSPGGSVARVRDRGGAP